MRSSADDTSRTESMECRLRWTTPSGSSSKCRSERQLVKSGANRQVFNDVRFRLEQPVHTSFDLLEREVSPGQFHKESMVIRLGATQRAVEVLDATTRQRFGQHSEALASSGFDDSSDQKPVQQVEVSPAADLIAHSVQVLILGVGAELQAS